MKRRSRKTKRFDFDFLIVHVENCAKYIINYLQGNFKLRLIFSPFVFSCMSGTYIFVLYKYTHIYISMCAPQLVSLFQILNFLFLSNLIFVCNFLFPVMHPISNSFMPAIGVTGCTVHVVLRIQSGKHRDTDTHTHTKCNGFSIHRNEIYAANNRTLQKPMANQCSCSFARSPSPCIYYMPVCITAILSIIIVGFLFVKVLANIHLERACVFVCSVWVILTEYFFLSHIILLFTLRGDKVTRIHNSKPNTAKYVPTNFQPLFDMCTQYNNNITPTTTATTTTAIIYSGNRIKSSSILWSSPWLHGQCTQHREKEREREHPAAKYIPIHIRAHTIRKSILCAKYLYLSIFI